MHARPFLDSISSSKGLYPVGSEITSLIGDSISIDEVLTSVKLSKYSNNFKMHGYYSLYEVYCAIDNLAQTQPAHHPKATRRFELATKKFLYQIGVVGKKDRATIYKKVQSIFLQQLAYSRSNSAPPNAVFNTSTLPDNLGRQYLDGTL